MPNPRTNPEVFERDLVRAIAEGMSNKAVARYFGLTESCVKNELRKLFHRHKLKNRAHVVMFGFRKGWLK